MLSQNDWVFNELRSGRSLTAKQAMDRRGIMRLASRINDLREWGSVIVTEMVKVKNRYGKTCIVARYSLDKLAV